MGNDRDTKQLILDTALKLAEKSHWEAIRLHEVAEAAGLSLNQIRAHFREKEDLIDAWFDRADQAMLEETEKPDFLIATTRDRLYRLIMAWLNALSRNRRVTRQMIGNKLEPGHVHIQIPAVMRISRTVQWMREAAQQKQTFLCRALEETALTGIYLSVFTTWMWDNSKDYTVTQGLLQRLLGGAELVAGFLPCNPGFEAARRRQTPPAEGRVFSVK